MYRFTIAVCLIVLVSFASLALADIPKLINYQGMLTNSSGDPLTGTYDINFKVYNASSGGDMRWEETQTDVAVTNGLFNVILGGATVGGIDLDFSEEYWLEIWVAGEQMSERLKFTSVGYAYRALVADSAVVAGSSAGGVGGWVDDGSTVRLQTSTDMVGIGTTNPGEELEIHSSYPYVKFSGHSTSDDYQIGVNNYGLAIYNSDDSQYEMVLKNDGKFGIGKTNPGSRLDIKAATGNSDGGLRITSSNNDNPVVVLQDANPGDQGQITLRAGNSDKVVLRANGDSYFNGGNVDVFSNEVKRYYGFPKPDYNSGWQIINQGQILTFNHSLGGSCNDYVVDLMFYDNSGGSTGPHCYGYGSDHNGLMRGGHWFELDDTQIKVKRESYDGMIDWVRVRIWVIRD